MLGNPHYCVWCPAATWPWHRRTRGSLTSPHKHQRALPAPLCSGNIHIPPHHLLPCCSTVPSFRHLQFLKFLLSPFLEVMQTDSQASLLTGGIQTLKAGTDLWEPHELWRAWLWVGERMPMKLTAVLVLLPCPRVSKECCEAGKESISTAAFQEWNTPDLTLGPSPGTGWGVTWQQVPLPQAYPAQPLRRQPLSSTIWS